MSDDRLEHEIEAGPRAAGEGTAEDRRNAARRRFLRQGAAAGSGIVIYTIHHNRSFANTTKTAFVSSVAACESRGGSDALKTKVVDSVNPVQKTKTNGRPMYDSNGNAVYEETKEAYECQVKV